MKLLTFALLGVVATVSADYSGKFEDFDVPKLFADEGRLRSIIDCFLEEDSCTEEEQSLKDVVTESVRDKCARCSVKQEQGLLEAIKRMSQKDPEILNVILQRFDPTGEFKAIYLKT
uniref:Chemosensory protein n=1 Tax=Histia rhodope TaxID=1453155 RepID=A0A6M9BJ41_9NEOP|nr:chemosensory protein [Histia rhodope]